MSAQQLLDLRDKRDALQAVWFRQLLTLAAGGLALLVGLGPPVSSGIERYFLAGTWVFLGLGVLSGSAATYLEVSRANNLEAAFRSRLVKSLDQGRALSPSDLISAGPHRFFSWSQSFMVVSLLLAVCCLVSYAVLTTLAAPPA